MNTIAVIDYGMGNLHSASKALEYVAPDAKVIVTNDPQIIADSDRVVLPGVGAIRDCIAEMQHCGVDKIVADTLGINQERIIVSAARTDKVPNTSPTAASAGTDLNGMAAKNAAEIIKRRLFDFIVEAFEVSFDSIQLKGDKFFFAQKEWAFED